MEELSQAIIQFQEKKEDTVDPVAQRNALRFVTIPNINVGTLISANLMGSLAAAYSSAGQSWQSYNLRRKTYKPCGMTKD